MSDAVRDFSALLGLDILYMGNEGKMVCAVASGDKERAVDIIRSAKYGEAAEIIGYAAKPTSAGQGKLILKTGIGGERIVGPLYGEGLPRIC